MTHGADEREVRRAVAVAAERPHPRLIFTSEAETELRARIPQDATLAKLWRLLRAEADRMIDEPPCERIMEGRRLLSVSREVLRRVTFLAVAARLSGDSVYARRAEDEMLHAAEFTDWNPSHWLDVAELAAALAYGYDWLYPALSPETRVRIEEALRHKAIDVYTPVTQANNWNDVCNGAMAVTALALAELDQDGSARVLRSAIEALPVSLRHYSPRGGHPEGPGSYWRYATRYTVPTIAACETACGTDFGLLEAHPGVLQSGAFFLHMHGPTQEVYGFSDANSSPRPQPSPQMFWLSARARKPEWMWQEMQIVAELDDTDVRARTLFFPFTLLWLPTDHEVPAPADLHYRVQGDTPVATHRSDWDPDACFVGLKGGTPGMYHAHMDLGSFIAEADGVRWAEDLGAQNYHSIEALGMDLWGRGQDSDRWSVFRLSDRSHNTITIAGFQQRVDGKAEFVGGGESFSILDLESTYKPLLSSWQRGCFLCRIAASWSRTSWRPERRT